VGGRVGRPHIKDELFPKQVRGERPARGERSRRKFLEADFGFRQSVGLFERLGSVSHKWGAVNAYF
jgi:hypothetical protein